MSVQTKITEEMKAQMIALWAAGKTHAEIAALYDISASWLGQISSAENWAKAKEKLQEFTRQRAQEAASDLLLPGSKEIEKTLAQLFKAISVRLAQQLTNNDAAWSTADMERVYKMLRLEHGDYTEYTKNDTTLDGQLGISEAEKQETDEIFAAFRTALSKN